VCFWDDDERDWERAAGTALMGCGAGVCSSDLTNKAMESATMMIMHTISGVFDLFSLGGGSRRGPAPISGVSTPPAIAVRSHWLVVATREDDNGLMHMLYMSTRHQEGRKEVIPAFVLATVPISLAPCVLCVPQLDMLQR
jgi:hypothetical protein